MSVDMNNTKKEIQEYMDNENINYNVNDTKKELIEKIEENKDTEKKDIEVKKVVVKVKNVSRQVIDGIRPSEEKQVSIEKAEELIKRGGFIKL